MIVFDVCRSEILLGSSSDTTAKDRARHLLVDLIEWVHRAFEPRFVDLFS